MRGTYDSKVDSTTVSRLLLEQPAKGYRYSIDAFLLAFFASRFPSKQVVEFGCGSGIISLLMAKKSLCFRAFELFEIQAELCRYAIQNVKNNQISGCTFTVRCEDLRFAIPSVKPELIVCNPPFRSPKSGRISANRQRAVARNWFFLTPVELFTSFLRMRSDGDSGLCLVLPFGNYQQWQGAAKMAGLHATHRMDVHSFADREATLVLVRFGSGKVQPSVDHLVLYERDGTYTKIAREISGYI